MITGNDQPVVRSRIDINDAQDITYWCGRLQCSERQLRAAVKKVGVLAKDVRMEIDRATGRR